MQRRDFLRRLLYAAASAGGLTGLLTRCAGGLSVFHGEVRDGRIIIPWRDAPQLRQPDGVMIVYARELPGSIVVRNIEGRRLMALSTICSHRGCEVRPHGDAMQCPCHGSEYDRYGRVVAGPATQPLKSLNIRETSEALIVSTK